jgi:DNA-directed RNA polymerase subunit alpha
MGLSLGMTFDEKYIRRIEEAIKRSEEWDIERLIEP